MLNFGSLWVADILSQLRLCYQIWESKYTYTTQTLISIKTLFLITGHTSNLTPKILHIDIYQNQHRENIPSFFFALPANASCGLAETMEPPEIEVVTVSYPIQFCLSFPLIVSFNCKTILIVEMSILLCLKCTFGTFQKSVIFG